MAISFALRFRHPSMNDKVIQLLREFRRLWEAIHLTAARLELLNFILRRVRQRAFAILSIICPSRFSVSRHRSERWPPRLP
jgi:hypothetical protein